MMEESWWQNLNHETAVLVPTRSLQTKLKSEAAKYYLALGKHVWESPNIITWGDLLQKLWGANRANISASSVLLTDSQALLIWQRVVEKSKRLDHDLALLNVQQTSRAAQRSWCLLHDWQLDMLSCNEAQTDDSQQFLSWAKQYLATMQKRNFIDLNLLLKQLLVLTGERRLISPYSSLRWYAFDLLTAAQKSFIAASTEIQHDTQSATGFTNNQHSYHRYQTSEDELTSVFTQARAHLETQANSKINIVVPDLQQRAAQVQTLAARIFYPGDEPLSLANNNLVYRFSLGQPLAQWPAIEIALTALQLLRGPAQCSDLQRLWRNQFLRTSRECRGQTLAFEKWLQRVRLNSIELRNLPALLEETLASPADASPKSLTTFAINFRDFLIGLDQELAQAADNSKYRALSFQRWREIFNQALSLWGWATATDSNPMSSLKYQLLNSWQQLLADFESLGQVQETVGLGRALELLAQLARDHLFLPKAADSPIFISGVYEALGSTADLCFVTGMTQDFPVAAKTDPFVGWQLRNADDYPSATAKTHFEQAQRVIHSLLATARHCHISYARQDDRDHSITKVVSPLFRHESFIEQGLPSPSSGIAASQLEPIRLEPIRLEPFQDVAGPALKQATLAQGGSNIFTNQANCAFKAFATHRLVCDLEQEAEFGLDPLDRGNVVHLLLEHSWEQLQTKQELERIYGAGQLLDFCNSMVRQTIVIAKQNLPLDKQTLLDLEHPRLVSLLESWLNAELQRPQDFSALELEQSYHANIGGIEIRFKLDRLDVLADGRTVIIDYKSGNFARSDWLGDRLRQPQLPLYATALSAIKQQPPAGIAIAKLKQHDTGFIELGEVGIFSNGGTAANNREQIWLEAKDQWPEYFAQLGRDFVDGQATVDPIDESTCKYCELQPLCRISQLRANSTSNPQLQGAVDGN